MRLLPTSPRALLALGLICLAGAVVGTLLWSASRPVATVPEVTTSPVTIPPSFAVTGAGTDGIGPFSARIAWATTTPATAVVSYGPAGMRPLLWDAALDPRPAHELTLEGLALSTTYDVAIVATSSAGVTARASFSFTTAAAPAEAVGATREGALLVNGAPFFPLITWQECPDRWAPDLTYGINLFAGNPCTGLSSLLTAIGGRALATGTSDDDPSAAGPGLVGWFFPDEADGRGLAASSLPAAGPGLRFLTLTSHFYSGAAPLPQGRGVYPGLIAKAQVVGFDLYPLQEFCRPELLPEDFDAQQELVGLAGARPTFQWIEVRELKCGGAGQVAITPATIRAESWLAIGGGAHGLGFFPPDWGDQVGETIRGIAARIRQIEPALLQPALPVGVAPAPTSVRASARVLHGAVYVIAVNGGRDRSPVRLTMPDLGDRSLQIAGSSRRVVARDGTIEATLPPLGVRIYVAAPGVS